MPLANKINILIIEDEKPAADYLEHLLGRCGEQVEIMARLATVRESVTWLESERPDLIMMDIHLADGNCFSIFDQVEVKTPVIFTTAYDQYAIKAFKVNSIDYLLKPIDERDLRKSLEKFKTLTANSSNDITDLSEVIRAINRKPQYQQRFIVYSGEKIRSVKTNEIAYFSIIGKDVFLSAFDGRNYGLDYSLEKIEGMLDPDLFFRINRKFIISIDAVDTMYQLSGSRIKINLKPAPSEDAIVSFHRVSSFKKWLNR